MRCERSASRGLQFYTHVYKASGVREARALVRAACTHGDRWWHEDGQEMNGNPADPEGNTYAAWSACGNHAIARASTRTMLRTPRGRLVCMFCASGAPGGRRLPAAACQSAGGLACSPSPSGSKGRLRPAAYRPRPGCLLPLAPTTTLRSSLEALSSDKHSKRSIPIPGQLDFTPLMFYLPLNILNSIAAVHTEALI